MEQGTVTVCTPDTDIFVVLLYHLRNTWVGLIRLHLLKSGSHKVTKRIQKELLEPGFIIDQLPAGHSLTGCDTVGKVGTKLSLLNTLETDKDLLPYFGKDRLDAGAIMQMPSNSLLKSCLRSSRIVHASMSYGLNFIMTLRTKDS